MTFQTLEYLIFFSIVFILYWTLCRKCKDYQNGLIVVASLAFYGWWDWHFLGLLFITAMTTFLSGLCIGNTNDIRKRKFILIGTILINIGILFFFKYFNFFCASICRRILAYGNECECDNSTYNFTCRH